MIPVYERTQRHLKLYTTHNMWAMIASTEFVPAAYKTTHMQSSTVH